MKKINWIYVLGFTVAFIVAIIYAFLINSNRGLCILLALAFIFSIINAIVSYKKDVKVITVIMFIFAVLTLILFGISLFGYQKVSKNTLSHDFQLTAKGDSSELIKIFDYDGKSYYTNGVSDVKVVFKDGKTYSLNDALNQKLVTLDSLLKEAIPNDNTTGYKIYYDGGLDDIPNSRYSIIVCEGKSNNVIIGKFDDKYKEGLCV